MAVDSKQLVSGGILKVQEKKQHTVEQPKLVVEEESGERLTYVED